MRLNHFDIKTILRNRYLSPSPRPPLPAKRDLEVTDEVLDGPQSIAILQAANRMHVAKGILLWLLEFDPA